MSSYKGSAKTHGVLALLLLDGGEKETSCPSDSAFHDAGDGNSSTLDSVDGERRPVANMYCPLAGLSKAVSAGALDVRPASLPRLATAPVHLNSFP